MNENPDTPSVPLENGHGVTGPADEPQDDGPFFEQTDWLSFWVTTAAAFVVYLLTLAAEVTLEYSGLLSTGGKYAGVAHPPGYPVWTIYAWLFTLLPFGNTAWKIAFSSAVAAAIVCGLVAMMVSRGAASIIGGTRGLRKLDSRGAEWVRMTSGLVAGMGFGLDTAFWSQAVIVETWSLGVLFLAVTLCLILRWRHSTDKRKYLYWAVFTYGLSFVTNQGLAVATPALVVMVALGDPALGRDYLFGMGLVLGALLVSHALGVFAVTSDLWGVYIVVAVFSAILAAGLTIKTRRLLTNWATVLASGCLLSLALSAYFFEPVASMTNPPMNWAYPRTVEGFVHLASRGQYETIGRTRDPLRFVGQILLYSKFAAKDLGLIYLLLALVPFCLLPRMGAADRRSLFGSLGLWLCLASVMLIMLNPDNDPMHFDEWYFSASHMVVAILAGYGVALVGAILVRPLDT